MKFSFCTDNPIEVATDLLGVGVFEDQLDETPAFRGLDQALGGALSSIAAGEKLKGKSDQSLLLHTLDRVPARRILLVGLGKREEFEVPDSRRYGAAVAVAAAKANAHTMTLVLPPVDASATERLAQLVVEGVVLGKYRFERYKSKEDRTEDAMESVAFLLPAGADAPHLALARGQVVAQAVCLARDLVNEPGSVLTPARLAEAAQTLATDGGLECKIFGPKECERQKMGLLLAVARGSTEEARFIHLIYRPKGKEKPKRRFALVGKGVTFDSGGLSLKPSTSMLDMKTDMAGAAALLGVASALGSLGVKSEVHLLIGATENMPSGSAYKIGDVVTGLGGKSVEIVNTDAEGRLILADALAYGVKLAPDEIIDVATLTGACVVALGPHHAGLMGNDRALVERFLAAARRAGEEVWSLPLPDRLKEQLKSPVADLKNSGERWGGALTAGLFLREFVGKTPWLHLDIAGPASVDKDWGHIRKGGTGFGVPSLLEYLLSRDD